MLPPGVPLTNAICLPSGDQAGWLSHSAPLVVSCVAPVPSGSIVQMSQS